MTIIEAIRIWSDHLSNYVGGRTEFWQAQEQIASLIAAYDALAPENAQWHTIGADGIPKWHCENPSRIVACDKILIPLGIDWRLCIWQRPEAQQ